MCTSVGFTISDIGKVELGFSYKLMVNPVFADEDHELFLGERNFNQSPIRYLSEA